MTFIPENIGELLELTHLDLRSNSLTGHIPDSIGQLASLEFFSAVNNSLIGEIPDVLWNLVNLTTLQLSQNELIGTIPVNMNVTDCQLDDQLGDDLCFWTGHDNNCTVGLPHCGGLVTSDSPVLLDDQDITVVDGPAEPPTNVPEDSPIHGPPDGPTDLPTDDPTVSPAAISLEAVNDCDILQEWSPLFGGKSNCCDSHSHISCNEDKRIVGI